MRAVVPSFSAISMATMEKRGQGPFQARLSLSLFCASLGRDNRDTFASHPLDKSGDSSWSIVVTVGLLPWGTWGGVGVGVGWLALWYQHIPAQQSPDLGKACFPRGHGSLRGQLRKVRAVQLARRGWKPGGLGLRWQLETRVII